MKANTVTDNDSSRWLVLLAFVVLVVVVGGSIGATSLPDVWYSALHKAPWNPPNWVFGPVWLLLYVLIAIAGARTWLRYPGGVSMVLWIVQMLLNWSWSPIWFRMHATWLAFAVIAAIFVSIVGFIGTSWRTDRASALLFLPYALWVGFASSLNLWIALFN